MNLAIFDLDHTLLDGDSDYLWGHYIARRGALDPERYDTENRRFHQQYQDGTLDIHAFARFSVQPLRDNDIEQLHAWRRAFVRDVIEPRILPAALDLIARHRARGDALLIITATNAFITTPIAELLRIPNLLATELEIADGRYTGDLSGTPTFRDGKVKRLAAWLADGGYTFQRTWFYSDSHNDLPLLEHADVPVAVDPDAELARAAARRNWPIVSLRDESGHAVFERVAAMDRAGSPKIRVSKRQEPHSPAGS